MQSSFQSNFIQEDNAFSIHEELSFQSETIKVQTAVVTHRNIVYDYISLCAS